MALEEARKTTPEEVAGLRFLCIINMVVIKHVGRDKVVIIVVIFVVGNPPERGKSILMLYIVSFTIQAMFFNEHTHGETMK